MPVAGRRCLLSRRGLVVPGRLVEAVVVVLVLVARLVDLVVDVQVVVRLLLGVLDYPVLVLVASWSHSICQRRLQSAYDEGRCVERLPDNLDMDSSRSEYHVHDTRLRHECARGGRVAVVAGTPGNVAMTRRRRLPGSNK